MNTQTIPYLAVARFAGNDAGEFLQSQLSADILALGTGDNTLACYCNPKGQVLGLLLVGREQDEYLVAANRALLPGILRRLQMYVLRSKVDISTASEWAVAGTPGPGFRFVEAGGDPVDEAARRAAELRSGITWLDENSSEKFIPQMLGFDAIGAVSFQKGCYPGQEIVARARYLGKVKRKPVIVEVEGAVAVESGEKVRLLREGEWSDAVVVDQARAERKLVLFTVAQQRDTSPEAVEIGGETYRCATM